MTDDAGNSVESIARRIKDLGQLAFDEEDPLRAAAARKAIEAELEKLLGFRILFAEVKPQELTPDQSSLTESEFALDFSNPSAVFEVVEKKLRPLVDLLKRGEYEVIEEIPAVGPTKKLNTLSRVHGRLIEPLEQEDAEKKPDLPADPIVNQVAAAAQRLKTTGLARQQADASKPQPPPLAKVYQLTLWPEPVRGVPNSFLRSALFAAIQGKTRRQMKAELLGSLHGISVRFTGEQLDQSDLAVWEQAIHLARRHPLGNVCHFKGHAFLKTLGLDDGSSQYQWLDEVIDRLVACAVIIRSGPRKFTGSLLWNCIRDEANRDYKLTLDPAMIKLYEANDWTAIEWEPRLLLKRKPLASWLFGFFSSHAEPYPMKVEKLRVLSGSNTKNPRHFKANLKKALVDLGDATGINAQINGDLVIVKRFPSPSQQRYLDRQR